MITTMFFIGVFLALFGHFKGRLDATADENIKELEWSNKYDFTKSGETKHWWYLGLHTPKFPEKFPFSSTALVFLTDKWHMYQFLMLRCFYMSLSLTISGNIFTFILLTFVIFPILVGVFFEPSYQGYRKKLREKYYKNSQFPYTPQGDEPQQEQITSVPEKQIEDEIH